MSTEKTTTAGNVTEKSLSAPGIGVVVTEDNRVPRIKGSKASAQRVGRLIREARLAKNMSQEALSRDIKMSKNIVANWERGLCRPDFDLIPYLCKLLDISIFDYLGIEEPVAPMQIKLADDESNLLADYRSLDDHHKRLISAMLHTYAVSYAKDYIEGLKETAIGILETEKSYAAGFGDCNLMEGENETRLNFYREDRIPDAASFVASVSGTSMEPTFHSGDKVFVERTKVVSVGDIGLFVLNGEGLIKEFHRDGLYSHNKRAKPKKFHEGDAFYVIGRVIRKVTEEDCFTRDELDDVWKLYHEGEINVREVSYDD